MRRLLLLLALPAGSLHAQSVLERADSALRAGRSWQATRMVAPLLAADQTRTPEAVVTGAQAAAGWDGWDTVRRLLQRESWLDDRFDRVGRRLLAEAELAAGRPSGALPHARFAVGRTLWPREDQEQGRRELILARIFDRLGRYDSAAVAYGRAGKLLPDIRDWVHLRQAGVTADPSARALLYRNVQSPGAKTRVGHTEAQALNRFGDRLGAANAYAALGARATALRLRYEGTPAPAARAAIVRDLLAMAESTNASDARSALETIAAYNIDVGAAGRLAVARRAVVLGRMTQAAAAFAMAATGGALSPADRYSWASALDELRRWREAKTQYRAITSGPLAPRAAYYAARADLRDGNSTLATAALRQLVTKFPNDAAGTGNALYLLADLELDAGHPDSARVLYRRIATQLPESEFAQRATLLAALIAHANGRHDVAARELESALRETRLTGLDADAGRYWLGRIQLLAEDQAPARETLRSILSRGPENYYALRAAARLDTLPWLIPRVDRSLPSDTPDALVRAARLEELGLETEAGQELDAFTAAARLPEEMVRVGRQLLIAGHPARASRVGRQALGAGAPRDARVWTLLYPLPYEDALRSSTAAARVDPYLTAAVIRQESAFQPRAMSGRGARGLMQVMPATGRDLARSHGILNFDDAMLWQPEVSLAFGTQHLAEALSRYPELERALAAYNAGPAPVDRWSRTLLTGPHTAADPLGEPLPDIEMFVERIPFLETRGYIRNIAVNEAMYRMLYGD